MASAALYGGTYTLLDVTLRRLGIETTFVAPDDPGAFAAAIVPGRTKLLYTEIVANPGGTVADLEALAAVAHDAGVPFVVDSTLATPYLCRPLDHGADVVLHSATKFLGGHGTSLGGVVVDSGRFPWDNGNFPVMTEPVATYGNLRFWDNFGEYGFCTKLRVEGLRNLGGVLSPFNAFLLLQGMETLPLRMDAHVANARAAAEFLAADERVSWVRYAGLAGDPNHALARRYLPKGPGAVFSFGLAGGREAGEAFIGRGSCARIWPTSGTPARWSSTQARRRTASSPRRRFKPRACCRSSYASAWGSRIPTTSSMTSTGRSGESRRGRDRPRGVDAAVRRRRAARSCAVRAPSPSSARRRTRRGRATSS